MSYKLTLHYSIQNGGDGSAYPKFMSSKALAEYDQEHMYEGWGEPCLGSITLESDSPITTKEEIVTPEGYLADLIQSNNEDEIPNFISEFFPNGKPHYSVKTREASTTKDYLYNDVYVDEVKVAQAFLSLKGSGQAFEDLLNS